MEWFIQDVNNLNFNYFQVVYELPTTNQWSFDVQWCPRNPGVISSCSFDGHISIYSLLGGGHPPATPTDKVCLSEDIIYSRNLNHLSNSHVK